MFGGDDDFDFIPDMNGDGDHDMMDLIIHICLVHQN